MSTNVLFGGYTLLTSNNAKQSGFFAKRKEQPSPDWNRVLEKFSDYIATNYPLESVITDNDLLEKDILQIRTKGFTDADVDALEEMSCQERVESILGKADKQQIAPRTQKTVVLSYPELNKMLVLDGSDAELFVDYFDRSSIELKPGKSRIECSMPERQEIGAMRAWSKLRHELKQAMVTAKPPESVKQIDIAI